MQEIEVFPVVSSIRINPHPGLLPEIVCTSVVTGLSEFFLFPQTYFFVQKPHNEVLRKMTQVSHYWSANKKYMEIQSLDSIDY